MLLLVNPETFISTCLPCSDCELKIVYGNGASEKDIFITDMRQINRHFLSSIKRQHPSSWNLYKIKDTYKDKNDYYEFVKITYELEGNLYTKSFTTELNSGSNYTENNSGGTIEVDCRGNCGPAQKDQICTEQWNINTSKVTCSCESDNCSMFIEVVDAPK